MFRPANILLCLALLAPALAAADPLTGLRYIAVSAVAQNAFSVFQGGPPLFGHLPAGSVMETASASAEYVTTANTINSYLNIPVPHYGDGSPASEDEILFTVTMTSLGEDGFEIAYEANFAVAAIWNEGPTLRIRSDEHTHDFPFHWRIESHAFRTGPVAVQPSSVGQIKRSFE